MPDTAIGLDLDSLEQQVDDFYKHLASLSPGKISERSEIVMWSDKIDPMAKFHYQWSGKPKSDAHDKLALGEAESFAWINKPIVKLEHDPSSHHVTILFRWRT